MNWTHLFLILLTPVFITVGYFLIFEDVGEQYFRTSPVEFFDEIVSLVTPEPVENEFTEVTEFLENLDPVATTSDETNQDTNIPLEKRATYEVRFVGSWSADTHGSFYISTAHFSPFVAWSHIPNTTIFAEGQLATPGIEKVAELGGTATLEQELGARTDSHILSIATGDRFDAPGESTVTLEVSESFPLVTAISMVAPSPDWFVAVEDVNLFEEDEFVDSLRLDVAAYDAGTEEGSRFTIDNLPTSPVTLIGPLEDIPTNQLPVFGYIEFTRVE